MGCLSPQLAIDFVAGALPAKPSQNVELHMAQCQDCRRLIVEIAKDNSHIPLVPTQGTLVTLPPTVTDIRSAPAIEGAALNLVRGTQVGRYTLLYPLGEGGMGSVHAAFDPKLDRRVALKFLRTDLHDSAKHGHRERLIREARALARLSHPNVVSIYDVAESGDSIFLAMELIDGNNARLWRELGDRRIGEILKIYNESLSALISAHQQGIIHRDFKPDNVMVGADGVARVTDFGLACAALVDVDELLAETEAQEVDWNTLTQTGLAVGTPRYMAPEQFCGQANELTDQFSFCLSMIEALYGHYPLGTKTPRSLVHDQPVETQLLAPLAKGAVPDALRKVLLRGLSVNPKDRWPSASELQFELSRIFAKQPSGKKWFAAAMLITGVVASAFYLAPKPPPDTITQDTTSIDNKLRLLQGKVDTLSQVDKELIASRKKNEELTRKLNEQEKQLELVKWKEQENTEAEAVLAEKRKSRKSVVSPLPVQSVERSVTTHLSEVLACYNASISGNDEETIRVQIGIAQSGKVKWVAAPYRGSHKAAKCLQAALKRLAFPSSEVDTTAVVTLSFFRLESGLLAVNMRAKTRNAELGQVTIDSKGRILVNCDPMDPLCGIENEKNL